MPLLGPVDTPTSTRALARSIAAACLAVLCLAAACAADAAAPRTWRPALSLARAADGTYALYSVTLTPDACYRAGPVSDQTPGSESSERADMPLALHVTRAAGHDCPALVWPVYHVRRGIRPGAHEAVRVYALRNGQLVSVARVRFADAVPESTWTPEQRAFFPP